MPNLNVRFETRQIAKRHHAVAAWVSPRSVLS